MSTTFDINEQQMCWSIIHCDSSSSKIAEAKPAGVFGSQTFKDSEARKKTRSENEGKKINMSTYIWTRASWHPDEENCIQFLK